MKQIVIFGIDNFSKKNINQIDCINSFGFEAIIFTNDRLNNSSENCEKPNSLLILKNTFFSRINQIYSFLKTNSKEIIHAEIYPRGRFSPFYLIICKLFKIKTVAVERGDLLNWKDYNLFNKFLLKVVYRFSDIVWYRELYMKEVLLSFGCKNLVFIHNCVPIKENNFKKNEYDFIWVNRLIKERKVKWFVDISNELKQSKNIILGVLNNSPEERYALNNQSAFLITLGYQEPTDYYLNSKFFVLPADIVYVNNSLLEAMSYGLVPLISDVEGARLIVADGIDGFVFNHTKDGMKEAMEKALSLTDKEYNIMSNNARKKVEEKFSCEVWCQKYIHMVQELEDV